MPTSGGRICHLAHTVLYMRTALLDYGGSKQRIGDTVNSVGIEPTHQNDGSADQSAWARPGIGVSTVPPGQSHIPGSSPQNAPGVAPQPQTFGQAQPTTPRSPGNALILALVALASVLAIAAIVVTEVRAGQHIETSTTTTVEAGPPTFSTDQIEQAKKDACEANVVTGAALTKAQRTLAAIPDRTSSEAQAALANYQTVVMIESEYLKSKTRPETPEPIRKAVREYTDALLAEIDAETRMLPLTEIDQRGHNTSATNHQLGAACK